MLFLQDINNLLSSPNTPKKVIDGIEYSMCTVGFLENSVLQWTEDEQRYHLKILEDKNHVRIVRAGTGSRRWIYIDHEKIEKDIDEIIEIQEDLRSGENPGSDPGFSPDQIRGKPRIPINESERSIKKESLCPTSSEQKGDNDKSSNNGHIHLVHEGNGFHKDKKYSKCRLGRNSHIPVEKQLADEFRRIMSDHGRLYKPSLAKTWQKDFEAMLYSHKEEDIRHALKLHDLHLEEKMWPKLVTVGSFHLEFKRIQDAIARLFDSSNGKDIPPNIITETKNVNGKTITYKRSAKEGE